MKIFSLFMTCMLMVSMHFLLAQTLSVPDVRTPGLNYYDVERKIHDMLNGSAGTTNEDQDYLALERWNWFWSHRLSGGGSNPAGFDGALEAAQQQMITPACDKPMNNGSNWRLLGPVYQAANSAVGPCMGIVVAVAHNPDNPNIIYVGTNYSGCWKTTNGGQTWTCITDVLHLPGLGVNDIKLDPTNPDIIFIATGGDFSYGAGVLHSKDGGQSWTQTTFNNYSNQYPNVYNLLVYHRKRDYRVYATLENHIWLSKDGGRTFNILSNSELPVLPGFPKRSWRFIKMKPDNPKVLYISSDGFEGGAGNKNPPVIFKTTNKGTTWNQINTPLTVPYSEMICIDVSEAAPDNLWTLSYLSLKKYSYSSNSWTTLSNAPAVGIGVDRYWHAFAVSPTQPGVMYFGWVTLYKNNTGGDSLWFTANGGHDDKRAIDFVHGSRSVHPPFGTDDEVLVATDGGIMKTTTGGTGSNPWTDINGTGLAITQFYGLCNPEADPNIIAGGAQDNGYFTYRPGFFSEGNNWKQNFHADAYDCECDGNFKINQTMYGVIGGSPNGGQSLKKSTDGGNSWNAFIPSPPDLAGPNHVRKVPMLTNPANQNFYVATRDVYTSRTDSFIKSFNPAYPGPNRLSSFISNNKVRDCQTIASVAVAPSNPNYIYIAFTGPTWNVDLSSCSSTDCAVACDSKTNPCNNSGNCTNLKIWRSTDGGASWTDIGHYMDKNADPKATDALRYAGVTSIAVDPLNPDRAWFTFDGMWGTNTRSENRVNYFNYDGNYHWRDISAGLPIFPVNKIVYQKNTNDAMYVGTDVGVFYTNAGLNYVWQCYNDNFPTALVTDLEINYSSRLIRASTFGRGIWESPLAP